MPRLKGATLLEAIVASVIFLTVFATVMELLPRLAVREDNALLVAEAEYRVGRAFEKYGTGAWPRGEYAETYEWGSIGIRITPYREFDHVQTIGIEARIDGSCKHIEFKQLVLCSE